MNIYMFIVVLASQYVLGLSCSAGWYAHGDSCYSFNTEAVTWPVAWEFCEIYDSGLVEIEDSAEFEFLVNGMKGNGLNIAWTAGSERLHRGTWEWTGSKQKFGRYTEWFGTEPSGPLDDCMGIDSGVSYKWNDFSCTLSYQFICEKKNTQPVQVVP